MNPKRSFASGTDTSSTDAASSPPAPEADLSSALAAITSQPPVFPPGSSVVMTNEQLVLLLKGLNLCNPVSNPAPGNFANCTSRYDGEKSTNVLAFIDAIEVYKECVNMDDSIALRGLPMLLTGSAAVWWQGVKATTLTWHDAIDLFKQTFVPPPHKIYQNIFEREQRDDESTDSFICNLRAQFAMLPPSELTEVVQLDMVYGFLNKRIRNKIPRCTVNSFAELLMEARRVEDMYNESRSHTMESSSVSASHQSPGGANTIKTYCNYCQQHHHKNACQRSGKKTPKPREQQSSTSVLCFGCGAPGIIRSNCTACKEKKTLNFNCSDSLESSTRPVIHVEICGDVTEMLLDPDTSHCIGSTSLKLHLLNNGHKFHNVFMELQYADFAVSENKEVAHVYVTVHETKLPVVFIFLPNVSKNVLGMKFVRDIAKILNVDEVELLGKLGYFSLPVS